MKLWTSLLLLAMLPLAANAQEIRYDTIKVSYNDERNILHAQSQGARSQVNRSNSAKPRAQFDRSKIRLGANLGLSISRNFTNLGIGPQIGYQFNNYFMAGAGLKYYYTKARFPEYEVKDNLFGGNLFGYFYPVKFFTIFLQPEINYTRSTLTYDSNSETLVSKGFAPSIVAGAGIRLGYTHLTINYDLVQHRHSPHPSGFFMGVSAFF